MAPNNFNPDTDPTQNTWEPQTEADVDWVTEMAMAAHNKLQQAREIAAAKIQQVEKWLEKQEKDLQPEVNHWEWHAINWFKKHRAELLASGVPEDKLPKTLQLPSGATLTAHMADGKTLINDADAAVKYLYQNGYREMVQVTRKPIAGEVKKHVRSTGELIPGIEVEDKQLNYKLKI